jgi:3-hydroxyisobutyrate dehydrogenase-like beta-hydroxyacid dehydrogenase
MKTGFIGLGRMGKGLAGNILKAGHKLTVFDVVPEAASELVAAGALAAGSVAECAQSSDVVVTMLASDEILDLVSTGDGGLTSSLPKGAIHMASGTHGVEIVRRLTEAHEKAGQIFITAHVLGRPDLAAKGELGVVPAGPEAALEKCQPLFDAIGRRTFIAGASPDAATSIKVANNFVLGCAIEAMGEAFALVRKYGVKPETFLDVMTDGLFSAPAYKVYGDIIARQDYDTVGVTAVIGLKDADLALDAAKPHGVPLPSCNVWRDRLLGAIAHGDGDKDWAVMARDQARASGLES